MLYSHVLSRKRRLLTFGLPAVLAAGLASTWPGLAAEAAPALPRATQAISIPGRNAPGKGPVPTEAPSKPVTVSWPAPGTATVDLDAAAAPRASGLHTIKSRAGSLPVWLAAPRTGQGQGKGKVTVEVIDREATQRARVNGLLLRLNGGTPGRSSVEIDYTGFKDAFGGGFGGRLQFVQLPECALTTPGAPGCQGTPLASTNNTKASRLAADVTLGETQGLAKSSGVLLAAVASSSSPGGDYKATPFQASATWSAGGASGDFSWSYPLRMPPHPAGPSPSVAFSYSAQSVDGRSHASNSQPSEIGEGFSFEPGSLSRGYKACSEDGQSNVADLCWGSDNATLSMAGHGGELIQISAIPDVWRPKNDDGSKVERLTGAANGAPNGEHWKVTTVDGTQYYFGLNQLPGWTGGAEETRSVFTIPVYGNNPGEPCHNTAGFASSWCQQPYTWNLDYVVDLHGNTMSYWYDQEKNNYARAHTDNTVSEYVRGGYVKKIVYGTRKDNNADSFFAGTAPAQVVFTMAGRCEAGQPCDPAANRANFLDVPWDQQCDSSTSCPNVYSGTFFTHTRLASVTTQIRENGSFQDVEKWTLNHIFKDPGDSHEKILWLNSISHSGRANTTTPDISFTPVAMNNRVDVTSSANPIVRYRVAAIHNESGGSLTVNYTAPDCVLGTNMPASPESNTKRCYPASNGTKLEYFHKYLVSSVNVVDDVGGAPSVLTTYTYKGDPAWHYDEGEFTPENRKTYGQWRGYGRVRTESGTRDGTQAQSDTIYFRGMHGDRLPGGTTRTVYLDAEPDFGTPAILDQPWRAGATRQTITYDGVGDTAPVAAKTLEEPWEHGPTATRTRNGVTVNAYVTGQKSSTTKQALSGGRGWRTTRVTNTFDTTAGLPPGRIIAVDDEGDTTTTADDTCTRTAYARNDGLWIHDRVVQTESFSVNCQTTPILSQHLIGGSQTLYDGATSYGTTVSKGDVTETRELTGVTTQAVYSTKATAKHDAHGRVIETADVRGRKNTTKYTPLTGGPVTAVKVTNAAGWALNTTLDPAWGTALTAVDVNNRSTKTTYDGLGRLTAVWLPDRSPAQIPSMKFSYNLQRTGGPSYSRTEKLNAAGNGYIDSYAIYDGLLRARQTQTAGVGGGRILTDTHYDGRGQTKYSNQPYYNNSAPSGSLHIPASAVPGQTEAVYDRLGRVTASIFRANGTEKFRTTTAHHGDRVDTTPPDGGTATSVWTDPRGRTTKLGQYKVATPTGAYDETLYEYDNAGRLNKITAPGGAVSTIGYDIEGRKYTSTDPDAGTSTYTYDDVDQLTSTTDGRGKKVAFEYDTLGRQVATYDTVIGGTKLTSATFDTLLKGQPASTTRWVGGAAYVNEVTGYDALNRVTSAKLVIPAAEGNLAGEYAYSSTFNADGSVATATLPVTGDLPAETLTYGYNNAGLPTTLNGLSSYALSTSYDGLGLMGTLNTSAGGRTLTQIWEYETGTNRVTRHAAYEDATATVYRNLNVSYNAAGNITALKDKTNQYGAGPDDNQCFKYDYLQRIKDAWTPASGSCDTTPSLSALGGPAKYWTTWTYAANGNRLTEVRKSTSGNVTSTYAYNTGQPHTVKSVTRSGAATGVDNYGYDTAGNTTSRPGAPSAQTLTWDVEGNLAEHKDNGKTATFVYDAGGNRLIRRDSATAATLYLGGAEIRIDGTSKKGTRYYSHAGLTIASRTGDGVTWLTADHQGTSQLSIGNSSWDVKKRYQTPFGTDRGPSVTWGDDKSFLGGTKDPSGLVHLGAREYDAATGRFVSADPLVDFNDPQQMNGYAYANNSPISKSDPSGLLWRDDDGNSYHTQTHESLTDNEEDTYDGNDVVDEQSYDNGLTLRIYKDGTARLGGIEFDPTLFPDVYMFAYHADKRYGEFMKGHPDARPQVAVLLGMTQACKADNREAKCDAVEFVMRTLDKQYFKTQGTDNDSVIEGAIVNAEYRLGGRKGKIKPPKFNVALARQKSRFKPKAPEGGGSCDNSFEGDTPVLMADGTTKPIEFVAVGDEVMATNPETGETVAKAVEYLHLNADKAFTDLTVTIDGKPAEIKTTQEHPFWDVTAHEWIVASQFPVGHELLTYDGRKAFLAGSTNYTGLKPMFNLTVADIHTYYVVLSSPVLVHNDDCDDEYLYRGIWPDHPQYEDAKAGNAVPTGWGQPGPKLTPEEHNGGVNGLSDLVSWTTSLKLAKERAKGGVVLRIPRNAYKTVKSPDYFGEQEVFVYGPVYGAKRLQ
ncbi:polymorphic toxin-type HINT domain-containing protein [Longispora albida]|uniref:polymorphic toxin-type HINT domain-containing protein n=1 Tax=Longispora albida TaxID=203523 RepID=UPI0003770137|nr:polymorphic toxin-type HINT domain-containing protein [Longispora albida]